MKGTSASITFVCKRPATIGGVGEWIQGISACREENGHGRNRQ